MYKVLLYCDYSDSGYMENVTKYKKILTEHSMPHTIIDNLNSWKWEEQKGLNKQYSHIIIDYDGILVGTEQIHYFDKELWRITMHHSSVVFIIADSAGMFHHLDEMTNVHVVVKVDDSIDFKLLKQLNDDTHSQVK